MKGVVFHTSERMITANEPARVVSGGVERPSHWVANPVAGLNASDHANADTTVTAP